MPIKYSTKCWKVQQLSFNSSRNLMQFYSKFTQSHASLTLYYSQIAAIALQSSKLSVQFTRNHKSSKTILNKAFYKHHHLTKDIYCCAFSQLLTQQLQHRTYLILKSYIQGVYQAYIQDRVL